MSDASLLAALDRTVEDLVRFIGWIEQNQAQGIDVIGRACAPRPPKSGAVDRALVGLLPTELAEKLEARTADPAPRNDPTGEAMLRAESDGRRKLMLGYMRGVLDNAQNLITFIEGGQPKPASPRNREAVANANALHCESCSRCKTPSGTPRQIEPVGGPRDLNGRLARKMLLCQQCGDRAIWRADNGLLPVLPPQPEVDAYRSGKGWPKVTVRVAS